MKIEARKLELAAIAAGIALGALAAADAAQAHTIDATKVNCYGVNKCKGEGECGGPGRSCSGTNSCRRKGFLQIDKETCLKLAGASLTPLPEGKAIPTGAKKPVPPATGS